MMSEDHMASKHKDGVRSRWSCALLGLLGILLGIVMIYGVLVGIGAVLIVGDPYAPVDAIVILSGDDGNRLETAFQMHNAGFSNRLVITETSSETSNRLVKEAQEAGFSPSEIFVTDLQVESTLDEAIAVRQFALDRGWDELMIVTDPFHTFRTRIIFRRELTNSDIEVLVRPVVGHWFTSTGWFLRTEGWQFMFLEIVKLMNYLFLRV
jgi:uncharacterized SAM-binding protein YcdF (DUF218 family)